METEKVEGQEKREKAERRKGTGEQYLYALIKCAEWVEDTYKQLAEKNRAQPEIMKELYMCACDGVPVEKVIEALEKNPPEGALKFVRRKYLQSAAMEEYQEQIAGIKQTIGTLEREVKQMSGVFRHIAEHVPDLDSLFPEEAEAQNSVPKSGTKEAVQENVPKSGTKEENQENVPKSGTRGKQKETAKEEEQEKFQEGVPKSGTRKKNRNLRFPWEKKKGPADFIEKSLEAGYSNEQLEYLLDCMEEGLQVEEIERFSSPKLPVEVMRRLRSLEERKETGE